MLVPFSPATIKPTRCNQVTFPRAVNSKAYLQNELVCSGKHLQAAAVVFALVSSCRRKRLGSKILCRQSPQSVLPVEEMIDEDQWGDKFDWKKAWYPLAVVEDLDDKGPSKLELLGEDLVAWKDGNGNWRVFEDRCPHRNVPLSEGRVESDGTLMCSYHGWRFNGEGRVTVLPQAKDSELPRLLANPRACATTRPVQIKEGVLWVWGESSADAALESALVEPNLPTELSDPALAGRVTTSVWSHRDVPYGWEVAFENVTDPAHVAVAHHNVVSNRYKDPCPIGIKWERKASNTEGFKYQTFPIRSTPVTEEVHSTMDFRPPCQMHIKSSYKSGASITLIINFVPTKPGWSRLVGSTMLISGEKGEKPPGFALFSSPLPRWLVHVLAPTFLHQDQVFLHYQQSILQKESLKHGTTWKQSYWIPTEADKGTITLRKWLDKNGGIAWSPGVSQDLAAMPDSKLLFDTYKTHTEKCKTCKEALQRTTTANTIFKYSAVIFASAALSTSSLPMLVGAGLLGLATGVTSKLKDMFYEVPFRHQDNN